MLVFTLYARQPWVMPGDRGCTRNRKCGLWVLRVTVGDSDKNCNVVLVVIEVGGIGGQGRWRIERGEGRRKGRGTTLNLSPLFCLNEKKNPHSQINIFLQLIAFTLFFADNEVAQTLHHHSQRHWREGVGVFIFTAPSPYKNRWGVLVLELIVLVTYPPVDSLWKWMTSAWNYCSGVC